MFALRMANSRLVKNLHILSGHHRARKERKPPLCQGEAKAVEINECCEQATRDN